MKTRFGHPWLPPEYSTVEEVKEDPLGLGEDQVADSSRVRAEGQGLRYRIKRSVVFALVL